MDPYLRQRLDQVAEDAAIARVMLETLERNLMDSRLAGQQQEKRLDQVERRVFALWIVGPVMVGVVMVLNIFKTWWDGAVR